MAELNNHEANKFALEVESSSNEFITYHNRPIYSVNNHSKPDIEPEHSLCIIIQGPILNYKSFTLESIKLYQKIFPYANIILSTWNDQDASLIKEIESTGINVILNEKPAYSGISNVNYQITSTNNAIDYAIENNYEFALKTRTDIRLHSPQFFIHCFNLLKSFPLEIEAASKLKHRLISVSEGNKYALMMTPDKNMFGQINDMKAYWSAPLDSRELTGDFSSLVEMAEFGIAESYLLNNFLRKLYINYQFNLISYWSILRDYFIIVDSSDADIYWCKYNRTKEYKNKHYFGISSFDEFTFKDWLRLFVNNYPIKNNEDIIKRKHGAILNDLIT